MQTRTAKLKRKLEEIGVKFEKSELVWSAWYGGCMLASSNQLAPVVKQVAEQFGEEV